MRTYSIQQIDNALASLPQELLQAMNEIDIDAEKKAIAEKYSLHIDKAGVFDNAVTETLIGLMTTEEFKNVLMNDLGLSLAQSPLLIADTNEKIFMPVREKMKEIEEINQPIDETLYEDEAPPAPPVAAAVPSIPQTPTDEHTILKNAEIELEKPRENVITEALDLSHAQMINRDTLMQSIENPPASVTSLPQKAIEKPAAVGVENAMQVPKIIPNQNIANMKMEEPKPFVGMPKSVGEAEKMLESDKNQTVSAPAGNIVAQKLQRTFNIPKQQSNYTLPSMKGEPAKQTDLYREPI